MSSLTNKKISSTYKGLLKTADESTLSATPKAITDGDGNNSGVLLDNSGNLKVNNTVEFGNLKDAGEDITIEKFVDEADGIANNDNDTSLPTSAAVKDYVDNTITAEDLDFSGNNGTGDVDLDSEVFAITGSNGITTTALDNTLDIDGSTLQTAINTNTSNIAANVTDIATNVSDIATNAGNISTNASDIVTNLVNISTNATNIASNDADIASNAANIATNTTSISNNAADITTNEANISTNTANIATNTTDIATNTGNISQNSTDIATNATNIASNDTDISALQTNVGTNTSNISQNTTDIATNASGISTNAGNISTNTSNISSNTTNIATNTSNVATNAADIAANTTSITNNAANISTNAAGVSTNATNIASNDADIAALQTDVGTNTTGIATNAANIASNDTDIATNAANIASNDTDIATNAGNISTNASGISSNATAITGKVSKAGDTMTNVLYINSGNTGQLTVNNRARFGTHYTQTDVWIYGDNGDNILLGGGIGSVSNNVRVENGSIYTSQGLLVGGQGTANLLNDYEEGTYNLNFQLFNNGTMATVNPSTFAVWTNRSKYTKIGNLVTIILDLEYQNSSDTNFTNSSLFVGLTNLPFSPIYSGTSINYSVGGTYRFRSFYQSFETGTSIFAAAAGYNSYGSSVALGGKLSSAYPGYTLEPLKATEFPMYRRYLETDNVHLTGTFTYQTNS